MRSTVAVLLGSLLLLSASAATVQGNTKDLEAIKQIERDWETAWNRHDVKALATLVAEDVDFVNVEGLCLKGRREFEEQHERVHAMRFKESVRRTTEVQVKFLKPDVAIVHVTGELSGERAPDGTPLEPRRGIFTRVVMKERGKWFIKASQNTAIRVPQRTPEIGALEPTPGLGSSDEQAEIAVLKKSQVFTTGAAETSLREFLPRFEEGTSRFINGDPSLWKENASRREDATIMGAWGGYEKGWNEVGPRYDWVAARLRESGAKVKVEYLSSGIEGDLAYTVAIERSELRQGDQEKPAPSALRVTHIFRKEDGAWKLVHRHADPLMDKAVPAAIPRK